MKNIILILIFSLIFFGQSVIGFNYERETNIGETELVCHDNCPRGVSADKLAISFITDSNYQPSSGYIKHDGRDYCAGYTCTGTICEFDGFYTNEETGKKYFDCKCKI